MLTRHPDPTAAHLLETWAPRGLTVGFFQTRPETILDWP